MVTFRETDAGLEIIPDDPAELADARTLSDAFDSQLANGWSWIDPAEIGALTGGEIITAEDQRNDAGELVALGRVYWNSEYAIASTLERLQAGETVRWIAAD